MITDGAFPRAWQGGRSAHPERAPSLSNRRRWSAGRLVHRQQSSLHKPVADAPGLVLEDGLPGQPAACPALVRDDGPAGGDHRVVQQLGTDDALGIERRGDGASTVRWAHVPQGTPALRQRRGAETPDPHVSGGSPMGSRSGGCLWPPLRARCGSSGGAVARRGHDGRSEGPRPLSPSGQPHGYRPGRTRAMSGSCHGCLRPRDGSRRLDGDGRAPRRRG